MCPDVPYLGASPDGKGDCDCCGADCVEIKCPYTYKDKSIDDICNVHKHHLLSKNGEITLKDSSPWYTQVQMQMYACKYSDCHLVIYTQVPPYSNVIKVSFNAQWWDEKKPKLTMFFNSSICAHVAHYDDE